VLILPTEAGPPSLIEPIADNAALDPGPHAQLLAIRCV
jgi:hypothetical protein